MSYRLFTRHQPSMRGTLSHIPGADAFDFNNHLAKKLLFVYRQIESLGTESLLLPDGLGGTIGSVSKSDSTFFDSRFGSFRPACDYTVFSDKSLSSAEPFSVFALVNVVDRGVTTGYDYVMELTQSSWTEGFLEFSLSRGNQNSVLTFWGSGWGSSNATFFYVPPGIHFLCFVRSTNSNLQVYVDGSLTLNIFKSMPVHSISSASFHPYRAPSLSVSNAGGLLYGGVMRGALSRSEVVNFTRDPAQIFAKVGRAASRVFYSLPSASFIYARPSSDILVGAWQGVAA